MKGVRSICKECGEEFFTDSENCGCDESLCEECFNILQERESADCLNLAGVVGPIDNRKGRDG